MTVADGTGRTPEVCICKLQGHLHKLARNPKKPQNRQTIDPNAAGLHPGEEVGGHPTPIAVLPPSPTEF